ncbi:hypothetical protein RND81_12G162300 [Saponaria officinalis]|uniref:EF-hand domain-containing protein n=1 Tax=Saponaria officinalis TaxID=3572 RepID=A0AAW1HBD4_SAPOF
MIEFGVLGQIVGRLIATQMVWWISRNLWHELDNEKWQELSQAAFEKFDVDKDGYITPDELRMHTELKGSMEPLLEEADIDKDGKISLAEFRRLLRSASMSSRNAASPSCRRNSRRA